MTEKETPLENKTRLAMNNSFVKGFHDIRLKQNRYHHQGATPYSVLNLSSTNKSNSSKLF